MIDSGTVDPDFSRVGGGGHAEIERGAGYVVSSVLDTKAVSTTLLNRKKSQKSMAMRDHDAVVATVL